MSETSDDDSIEFMGTAPPPPPPQPPPPVAKGDKKVRTKPKPSKPTSGAGKAPVKPSPGKEVKGKVAHKDSKKVASGNGTGQGNGKKLSTTTTTTAAASAVTTTKSVKTKSSGKAKATSAPLLKDNETPSKKHDNKKPAAVVVVKDKPKKKKKKPTTTDGPSAPMMALPPQKRPAGMMSILDLCNNNAADEDNDDDETEDDEPLRRTPSPQHPHRPLVMPSYSGHHVGGLYDDGISSVDEDDSASVVDSESGSIKTPPKKRAKKSTIKAPRPRPATSSAATATAGEGEDDDDDDDDDDGADEGWSDHNRWYCNICKDGGELLCCDRCPRAFHMACLGMKDKAIPDTEWFCKMCAECLDRRRVKKETREKARLMREAAKLERDATKRKMQQMKEDIIAQKNSEAIEHKAKRVLEMQDRILSRKKIKYKDKEEETLGKLAEDLAQTVRAAKERLEKLEKEDAALKKKEEAFNKKKKVGADETAPEDDATSATTKADKPTSLPCHFGDFASDHIGDLLAVWDCLTSFASIIEVAPVTLDQLAAGLAHHEPSALITEVHMCLLHLILEDREEEDYVSDDEASMDEAERFRFEIQHAPATIGVPTSTVLNSTSWPSVLYNLVLSVPRYATSITPALRDALHALNQKEYPTLGLSQKLMLLKFLISRAYGTEAFRQMLGKHVSESVNASKEFSRAALLDRKTAAEEEKKLREKQRLELGELVEQGKGSVKTWLKTDKKSGSNGATDTASVEGDDGEKRASDTNGASNGGGTAPSSDSELDDLTEEALAKNEEDLEQLVTDGYISRHEYLSRKKQLELQRDKLRRRAEEQLKKQKLLEQQERKRTSAKKSIQEALLAKDPTLLKAAIEKAKECDLPERIIVSATHVLEILDAEAVRDEEAEARKKKFNKTMRELFLRTEPLGRDKNGLRYWIFRGDKQHLYIEQPTNFDMKRHFEGGASTSGDDTIVHASWSCYSSQAEVKALLASLDERHVAEAQLRSALKENMDALTDEMPMAKPGLLLADMSNDNDAKKRAKGRAANGAAHDDNSTMDFLAWRNTKKSWKKKRHLESDMDAYREELLEVDAWLTKRLRELGSGWSDSSHADWVKSVKATSTIEDAAMQLLAVEHEVMEFQLRVQSLVPVSEQSERNGKPANGEATAVLSKDPEKSDEEDDDDDDELEEVEAAEDEGSVLWPTKKSRDRWVTEVKHARTMATLSAAFGSFVLRLDAFGLSEFATDDTVATRRAKTEKEKQSRKERAVKKKQQQQEAEEADVDTDADAGPGSRRHSIDDWEEDCYICTEGGELLCCDGCPRVFHYPCVGLRRVPRGKTFCHYCDPTVKPVYPVMTGRKSTRAKAEPEVVAESVDGGSTADSGSDDDDSDAELAVETGSLNAATKTEDQWDVECGVCRLGGELLCCDGCPRAFHTKCIDLKTVPEDEWFCDECNLQTCGLCKKNKIRLDAHVICGSEDGTKGCEKVFHLKCAKLSAVPEDDWYCKKCQKTLSK